MACQICGVEIARDHRGRKPAYDLQQLADLYREGLRASDSPTRYVAESLGVSRSTAAKQVARARAAGRLEAAPKQGVAGLVPVKRPNTKPKAQRRRRK